MESAILPEDASKEVLLVMFRELAEQKCAAEESCAQSNVEKDKIKEKALALLKRCRDLESKQGEIDELKKKVLALEESSSPASSTNEARESKVEMQLSQIISDLRERCKALQSDNDLKIAELKTISEESESNKNQGMNKPLTRFSSRQ